MPTNANVAASAAASSSPQEASLTSRATGSKMQQITYNFDCYWVILATNVMRQILILEHQESKRKTAMAVYMIALADALTTILLSDKSKLEKCSTQPANRSILCRAVLTTTLATMYGIRNYDPELGSQQKHKTYEAAVTTLDRLVHLRGGNAAYRINVNENDDNNTNCVSTIGKWNELPLEEECSWIEELLGSASPNPAHDCVKILLETNQKTIPFNEKREKDRDSTEAVPGIRHTRARPTGMMTKSLSAATKRKATMKRKSASVENKESELIHLSIDPQPIVAAIEKLLESEGSSVRIDGRVAVKRWPSIAVVWSQHGEGQNFILQQIHELCSDKKFEIPFTPFEKSRLMSTLISIIIETGTQCGVRPPTGGIEQYLVNIDSSVGKMTSKSAEESKSKRHKKTADGNSLVSIIGGNRSKKLRRADIRNWTTTVIHDYLQNHKKCLLANAESTRAHEDKETTNLGSQVIESHSFSAPNFSDLMTGLSRIASSSVHNSSYTQQNAWKKALLSIAAAFCFEMTVEPAVPLDSKMISFALSQFVENIRMIDPQLTTGITSSSKAVVLDTASFALEKQTRDFESKHLLRERLPTPIVPTIHPSSSQEELQSIGKCNFAGILINTDSFTDEDAVALAIRAVQTPESQGDSSPATGKLLTFLLDLVKRAYDTRKPDVTCDSQNREEKKSSITGKRKRSSRKVISTNRRGSRRRKTEFGDAKHVNDNEKTIWNRVSPEKASVAIPALNAIRMWLMNTKRTGSCTIRKILRSSVTIEHMLALVELGDTLDKIVVKTRGTMRGTDNRTDSPLSKSSHIQSPSLGNNFSSCEILLWNAHMITCQVMGRGQLTYTENSGLDPIIWNPEKRISVYKAITAAVDSSVYEGTARGLISLPAAHHAFLATNMSCTRYKENKDPERHIVAWYVNSIIDMFSNLENLAPKDWGSNERIIDDDIPLSYDDARTFMLAIDCLSFEDKFLYFDLIVDSALDALNAIMKSKAKRESLLHNSEASGFIARVIVVCYSLLNHSISGKELEEIFFGSMGRAQMHMPTFNTRADWYRRDRTFMGIFDAWESSSLPVGVPKKKDLQTLIPKKSLENFHSLLETSFSLGFDAAPHDHCHLLFAAWNGLDQVPEKIEFSNSKEEFPSLTTVMDDYPSKILQLRKDIFSIHKASNAGVTINLKGMISRASDTVDAILSSYISDHREMQQEIPLTVMALLAALPTYIAAGISCHTKPGNDYFSTIMSKSFTRSSKRHRGYSSESDPPPSDCESDEDVDDYENEARIDAMSRLRECCDAFGAAPIHPDWLDCSCSLRDGIRTSDATEAAENAIKTLSRLITIAFDQYKRHQSLALQMFLKDEDKIKHRANLCATLMRWSRHDLGPSQYPNNREWLDDIATVSKIPHGVLEYMLEDLPTREIEQTKGFWCPYAGQKLRGLLQEENRLMGGWETSEAELRAGGEWELLLAEALCVSSMDMSQSEVDYYRNIYEVAPPIGPEPSSEMAKAQIWRTVFMSATSHLVPAAALLRLALGKVGRKPHPFAFHENNQDPYDSAPIHFSERLNGADSYTSSSLRSTVCETLAVLARLPIEAEESLSITCHAIASHLVVDTNAFSELESMSTLRCSFMGLDLIREIAQSSPKKDVKAVIPFIVERLVSLVEYSGRGNIGTTASDRNSNSQKYRRLHHFMGDPPTCLIETIASKSVDIFKILKSRQIEELCEGQVQTYKWSHDPSKANAVDELVSILCEDSIRANGRTRSHIALMLSSIGLIESQPITNSATAKCSLAIISMINSFNKTDRKHLKSMVVKDMCGIRGNKFPSETFRRDMASILCLLLFSESSQKFDKAKFVHDTLMTAFDSWGKIDRSHRKLTLSVLLAYGAYFNTLFEIGSKLVEQSRKILSHNEPQGEAELLSIYFSFIKNLREALINKDQFSSETREKDRKSTASSITKIKILPSDFPKSCSFIQKSGFHGQHWYHCKFDT